MTLKKTVAVVAIVNLSLAVLATAGFFVHRHYAKQPEQILSQINQAVVNRNVEMFKKYVDTIGIGGRIADAMITGLIQSYGDYLADLPDGERIEAVSRLKNLLDDWRVTMGQDFQRVFDDLPVSSREDRQRRWRLDEKLLKKSRFAGLEECLDGIGNWKVVRKVSIGEGAILTVVASLPDSVFDKLALDLVFEKSAEGHLRWVEIRNAWDFFQTAARRQYQWYVSQNEPKRDKIRQAIELTRIERTVVTNANFAPRSIQAVLYLKNNSNLPITSWEGTLEMKNLFGRTMHRLDVAVEETRIGRGETLSYTFEFKVDPRSSREDEYLCGSQPDEVKAALWVNGVVYANFDSVKVPYSEVLNDRPTTWDLMRPFADACPAVRRSKPYF